MPHEKRAVPYPAVFAATPSAVLVLTPDLVICEATDAYLRAVCRTREQLLGKQLFDVFPDAVGTGMSNVRASMERALETGRPDTMAVLRYDLARDDGRLEERYWSTVHVPVLDDDGHPILLLHRAEDVTDLVRDRRRTGSAPETDLLARLRELEALNAELRETRDQLAVRALHDPMTGLLVRPVLLEQASRALCRTSRRGAPLGVLFVDLDRLKEINDRYGHAAGDELIRGVAARMRASVRPGDAIARFGGDEFVVLLEDLRRAGDAEGVAARVLSGLRRCPVPDGLGRAASASIGVAVTTDVALPAGDLIDWADQAMYRAKQAGGDRYEVFAPV